MKKLFTKLCLLGVLCLIGGNAWAYEIPTNYEIKQVLLGTKNNSTVTAETFDEIGAAVASGWTNKSNFSIAENTEGSWNGLARKSSGNTMKLGSRTTHDLYFAQTYTSGKIVFSTDFFVGTHQKRIQFIGANNEVVAYFAFADKSESNGRVYGQQYLFAGSDYSDATITGGYSLNDTYQGTRNREYRITEVVLDLDNNTLSYKGQVMDRRSSTNKWCDDNATITFITPISGFKGIRIDATSCGSNNYYAYFDNMLLYSVDVKAGSYTISYEGFGSEVVADGEKPANIPQVSNSIDVANHKEMQFLGWTIENGDKKVYTNQEISEMTINSNITFIPSYTEIPFANYANFYQNTVLPRTFNNDRNSSFGIEAAVNSNFVIMFDLKTTKNVTDTETAYFATLFQDQSSKVIAGIVIYGSSNEMYFTTTGCSFSNGGNGQWTPTLAGAKAVKIADGRDANASFTIFVNKTTATLIYKEKQYTLRLENTGSTSIKNIHYGGYRYNAGTISNIYIGNGELKDGNKVIIGSPKFNTGYLAEKTSPITLADGESVHYTFVNHNAGSGGNWKNWILNIQQDNTDIINLRADNWEDKAGNNNGCTSDFNWNTFVSDMNGALVDMNVAYADGYITMSSNITTVSNIKYTYSYTKSEISGNITTALTVNEAWLEVLTAVKNPKVTVSTVGMTTFCSPYNLDFTNTESIKAYKGVVAGEKVTLEEVDKVPAGAGVLLVAEDGAEEIIPVVAEADELDGNQFVGVLTETTVGKAATGTNYVLAYNSENVSETIGFYSINGTSATVAAGKAYLYAPASLDASTRLTLDFGDVTGINAVENVKTVENGATFNLSGQRVSDSYKGVVIKNGVKYFNK